MCEQIRLSQSALGPCIALFMDMDLINDCLLHSSELIKERKENICEKTRLSQSALAI